MNPRYRNAVPAILAAAGLALAGTAFADSHRGAAAERSWLSIPEVHRKLEAAGYRNIEKIERERGGYEVRATDRDGRRVKLDVDAARGEVIERRFRDGDRRGERADGAECSKRRCRDDLPAAPASR
jgi:hypothetical protein